MSETFKSDNELAKTISITRSQGRVLVEIEDPKHLIAINLSDNNAPALALAILEAAGGRDALGIDVGNAMTDLREYVTEQERITAEAEAQAGLEAEALVLANAFNKTDWDFFPCNRTVEAHQWLAVARKARQIGAKK